MVTNTGSATIRLRLNLDGLVDDLRGLADAVDAIRTDYEDTHPTSPLDLAAIEQRASDALHAKPGKGDWTPDGVEKLVDTACDVHDLLAEVRRLRADLASIQRCADEISERFGEGWPHHGGCMGDPADSGCPLCRILAATRADR